MAHDDDDMPRPVALPATVHPMIGTADGVERLTITLPSGRVLIVDDYAHTTDVWVTHPTNQTWVRVGDTPQDGFATFDEIDPRSL